MARSLAIASPFRQPRGATRSGAAELRPEFEIQSIVPAPGAALLGGIGLGILAWAWRRIA